MMNKTLLLIFILIFLHGCQSNPHLKRVIKDIESTPRCDDKPVLLAPKDTKRTLAAKLVVVNFKIACFKDYVEGLDKKLEAYKDIL